MTASASLSVAWFSVAVVVPKLDEMSVRIEQVDGFAGASCSVFVARSATIVRVVERIAEWQTVGSHSRERRFELRLGKGEGEVNISVGPPGRELQGERRRHAHYRKWRSLPIVAEPENRCVERDAFASVVDGQDQVVEFGSHGATVPVTASSVKISEPSISVDIPVLGDAGCPSRVRRWCWRLEITECR